MSQGFYAQINTLIKEADVILEVVDARFIEATRNKAIEEKVRSHKKNLIIAINKSDLITKKEAEIKKQELLSEVKARIIFVSAKEKDGMHLLRKEINMAKGNKESLVIGLLGYPNSGKSTLINSLGGKGKGKVGTSSKAGFTRGLQRIRLGDGVYLIDAPGIIPYENKDEYELFLVGAKNANQLKEMENCAVKLIEQFKTEIQKKFNITSDDAEEILEEIGKQKNFLAKGGSIDSEKTARWALERYERHELI